MSQRKCGVCGELGHNARRHAAGALPPDTGIVPDPPADPRTLTAAAQMTPDEVALRESMARHPTVTGGPPGTPTGRGCYCRGPRAGGPATWHLIGAEGCVNTDGAELFERLAAEPAELPDVHESPVQAGLAEAVHGETVAYMSGPTHLDDLERKITATWVVGPGDSGPPAEGSSCDCLKNGDFHPPGTGGCILPSAARYGPAHVASCSCSGDGDLHLPGSGDCVLAPFEDPAAAGVPLCEDCTECFARFNVDVTQTDCCHDPMPYPFAYRTYRNGFIGETIDFGLFPFVIREPGVYGIPSDVYHADPTIRGSMSNSDGKALSLPGCPAQFRYDRDHGVHKISSAFDLGHAAHREVLGVGETLAVFPKHDARTKEGKRIRADWDYARANGRTPITEDVYEVVQGMAGALREHEFAARLLAQPGKPEQALFWEDPQTGVWRRSLVDFLPDPPGPNRTMILVDYKTADQVAPDFDMSRKIYSYRYHRQGATYLDGVLALGLADDARIIFLFQSTRPPYLVTPVELDAEALRIGRIENRRALNVFAWCQATGEWPSYTDGVETVGLPPYIEREYEGIIT